MQQFDSIFFSLFRYYKPKYKTKANDIALVYILILQASILLLLGSFFMLFFDQMNVSVISNSKACILYILLLVVLLFRNWIYYTGKKRRVLNTVNNKTYNGDINIVLIWLIPIVCFIFSALLIQRL